MEELAVADEPNLDIEESEEECFDEPEDPGELDYDDDDVADEVAEDDPKKNAVKSGKKNKRKRFVRESVEEKVERVMKKYGADAGMHSLAIDEVVAESKRKRKRPVVRKTRTTFKDDFLIAKGLGMDYNWHYKFMYKDMLV